MREARERHRLGRPARAPPRPPVYVEVLLGAPASRDAKVRCSFHLDATPSLHVYSTPEQGWYCFGCRLGGTIFDLAAEVWGMDTRGPDFLRLRRRLREALRRAQGSHRR